MWHSLDLFVCWSHHLSISHDVFLSISISDPPSPLPSLLLCHSVNQHIKEPWQVQHSHRLPVSSTLRCDEMCPLSFSLPPFEVARSLFANTLPAAHTGNHRGSDGWIENQQRAVSHVSSCAAVDLWVESITACWVFATGREAPPSKSHAYFIPETTWELMVFPKQIHPSPGVTPLLRLLHNYTPPPQLNLTCCLCQTLFKGQSAALKRLRQCAEAPKQLTNAPLWWHLVATFVNCSVTERLRTWTCVRHVSWRDVSFQLHVFLTYEVPWTQKRFGTRSAESMTLKHSHNHRAYLNQAPTQCFTTLVLKPNLCTWHKNIKNGRDGELTVRFVAFYGSKRVKEQRARDSWGGDTNSTVSLKDAPPSSGTPCTSQTEGHSHSHSAALELTNVTKYKIFIVCVCNRNRGHWRFIVNITVLSEALTDGTQTDAVVFNEGTHTPVIALWWRSRTVSS